MTRPRLTQIPIAPTAALLAASWCAGQALGQYQVDDGRALDRNTALNSNGINEASRVEDFRARNLLVTGNVAGGRGFRGTVGYAAEDDFRGVLGSDDIYPFLADSAYSAPSFLSAGGTAERLRFGGYLGTIEFRRSAGYAASLRSIDEVRYQQPAGVLAPDQFNVDHVALASSSGMRVAASAQPEFIGAFMDREGRPIIASASVLRGLQLAPLSALPETIGLTSYDMARARQDVETGRPYYGIGDPFDVGFRNLDPSWAPPAPLVPPGTGAAAPGTTVAGTGTEPRVFANRLEPGRETGYRRILERILDRYRDSGAAATPAETTAGAPGGTRQRQLLEDLETQMARLREQLTAAQPPEPTSAPASEQPKERAIDKLAPILSHGERLDRLSSQDRTRFDELMASAEQALAEGEYFWAERKFDRALRFTPGHPMALAGRGHARIGAGLYVSAAMSLHRLLVDHPEMIDVTYAPQLLPNRVRLDSVVRVLEQQAAQRGRDQAMSAFLLAYLGHQLADRSMVERGLTAMATASPDDLLLPLLRKVWGAQPPRGQQP